MALPLTAIVRSKTKNAWGAPFERHEGKYQLVETEGDGDDSDAALGRLSEAQIHKGQEVLAQLRSALGKKKPNKGELGRLSNEYYSLIPTMAGRQRPPRTQGKRRPWRRAWRGLGP